MKKSGKKKLIGKEALKTQEEVYQDLIHSATIRAKRFVNEEYYLKTLGANASSMRITIPALTKQHVSSAAVRIKELATGLEDVYGADIPTELKILSMRSLIYQCHRALKEEADRGYSDPNRPHEDFRGAR